MRDAPRHPFMVGIWLGGAIGYGAVSVAVVVGMWVLVTGYVICRDLWELSHG